MSTSDSTDFVSIWNSCSTLSEVCEKTGKTRRQCVSLASSHRCSGRSLKFFERPLPKDGLPGKCFGEWTVIEVIRGSKRICECSCGEVRTVQYSSLTKGASLSCGKCKPREWRKPDPKKNTPEYRTWVSMKARCDYPHLYSNRNHGGRGIKVCDRWRSYDNFLADMGQKPSPDHSIDRIDNDGDYKPGNCRWATRKEQSNNTRSNSVITIGGVSKTLSQWCDESGINVITAAARIRDGWSEEDAVFKPIDRSKRNRRARDDNR